MAEHVPLKAVGGRPSRAESVALGFVRLAILDLSPNGDQPMVAPGRAALLLNGEIYNYVELRDELRTPGWMFASTGDAEVLLKVWLEWGEGLFLNGMWAIAIYDFQRDALLHCRARFGEKPLFWTPWRNGIASASEAKQLAAFPDIPIQLNPRRAAGYVLSGRPYDGPSSWFENSHQVEPGSALWVDLAGRRQFRYWDLREEIRAVEPERDASGWQRRFQDAFTTSVRIRLRSDVPMGTSLSSGIDSSTVLATATALEHTGHHGFTLTSDDRRQDEGGA
jgi:asparagine synthase (glutamine-hydrolysing)